MLQQRTNNGIDCHLQIRTGQIHAVQNLIGIIVDRGGGKNLFFPVYLQPDTGIHVEGDHRGYRVGLLIPHSGHTAANGKRQAGSRDPGQDALSPFGCGNRNNLPILGPQASKHRLHIVRRGVLQCRMEFTLQFLIIHGFSPPSSMVRSFCSARRYLDSTVDSGRSSRCAISLCFQPVTAWRVTTWRSSSVRPSSAVRST